MNLPDPPALLTPIPLFTLPAPVSYRVTTRWEERLPGQVARTLLERDVTVTSQAESGYLRVTLHTNPPTWRKRERTAHEQLVLRLAALYERLGRMDN